MPTPVALSSGSPAEPLFVSATLQAEPLNTLTPFLSNPSQIPELLFSSGLLHWKEELDDACLTVRYVLGKRCAEEEEGTAAGLQILEIKCPELLVVTVN